MSILEMLKHTFVYLFNVLWRFSTAQIPASVWSNLDMKELEYAPSDRDLDNARINRLLDASMLRPYRRVNIHRFYCAYAY
jgi:hypothetical protein